MNNLFESNKLFLDVKSLIEQSKMQAAVAVNSEITMLYWNVGKRIREEILNDKRTEYGKEIIKNISLHLIVQYGSGWSEKHLRHCLRFAETFPDIQIVSALRRQLTWTHIRSILLFWRVKRE